MNNNSNIGQNKNDLNELIINVLYDKETCLAEKEYALVCEIANLEAKLEEVRREHRDVLSAIEEKEHLL